MTPFDNSLLPSGCNLKEFAGKKVFKPFDMWCSGSRIPSRLISGPEGMGKSTLVKSYFTRERCRELADRQKILVQLCYFSDNDLKSDEAVFLTLIKAVKKSLNDLDPDSDSYRELSQSFQKICAMEKFARFREDWCEGQELLEALTEQLREQGYCVTLVIDDFQLLTCSKNCAVTTFSAMAGLAQQELLSYIVITDLSIRTGSQNYTMSAFERIFGADPLIPAKVIGSRQALRLQKHIREMLANMQEDGDEPVTFTDDELAYLWVLTDGIPGLLQCGARALYLSKEACPAPLPKEELQKRLLSGCRNLMERWARHFDDDYWLTLREILDQNKDNKITAALPAQQDRRTELRSCGLIEFDMNSEVWSCICPLFELYLRETLARPQKKGEDMRQLLKAVQRFGGTGMTLNLMLDKRTVIQGDYVASGAAKVTLNVISANDLLSRLGLGRQPGVYLPGWTKEGILQIGARLRGELPSTDAASFQSSSQQDADHVIDLLLTETGKDILPDIDPDTIADASMEKLDQRFLGIRSRIGLEEELDDELLASLSPLCRFYVKAALVVEDHMENIIEVLNDYSVHLVMYGKCLEQSLRDSLFPLLKTHPSFRDHNTYTRCDTPGDDRTFGAMSSETQAMLGSFYYILSQKSLQLGRLCSEYQLPPPDGTDRIMCEAEWITWWDNLARKVCAMKNIRNRVHAGSGAPTKEDLSDLRQGTFGRSGVLRMSQVGKMLYGEVSAAAGCV